MPQIKYLTIEDLTRLGVKVERYPITRHILTVSVVVALNHSGDQAEFRMSVREFNKLHAIPTHDSVAEVPRNV